MPELILAIDVGTTTARAALFTPAGTMAGLARAPVRSVSPAPGRVEQDAVAIWRTIRRLIARVLAGANRTAHDLAAIGVTTQRTSAVIWDRASGRPLSPLVVWSDRRGEARAAALREAGYPLVSLQAATKLEAMLAAVEGDRRRFAWGNIDSFLIWRLTGGAVHLTDRSQAWPTGYLDLSSLGWNPGLIALQGLDEGMFPTLVDTRGPLAESATSAIGARVPIAADIADQQASLIAHGGETVGAMKLSYGTSATLDVGTGAGFIYKSATAPPFVLSHVEGETLFCLEGMVLSAGAALDWVRETFRLGGHGRVEALVGAVADAGGAAFLPALNGLGPPYGDPTRRATFAGLTAATGRGEIARAAMEGVAFRVREVFDHVRGLTGFPPPAFLPVDGGLAASDGLLQMQADLLGLAVRRHAHLEATACGAAMCAGRGVGLLTAAETAAFTRYGRTFEPAMGADEAAGRLELWKKAVYGEA
ncbi:MAG: FGGY family carbohydrate kinase [Caulobacteraceae bacterium]